MRLAIAVLLVACGGSPPPPAASPAPAAAHDTRTPIEQRRDAACEQLAPKLFACARQDAKNTMTPAAYAKLNPDELREAHRKKWLEKCEVQMSSRQVRVLEVCYREATECDPLADCLANLQPQAK